MVASSTASDIGETRIGIKERRFHLQRGLFLHPMAMDDVGDIESSNTYFADALQPDVEFVPFNLGPNMGEDAVTLALANVERFAISRINEAIHVSSELGCHASWKRLDFVHVSPLAMRSRVSATVYYRHCLAARER